MVPTLLGRIQTRLFLLAVVGGCDGAADAGAAGGRALADRYRATYVVLAAVAVLGLGWELVYHFLMQWRWEKDWPTLFGLLTLVPEGAAGLVGEPCRRAARPAAPVAPRRSPSTSLSVWLVVWLVANGPLRVPCIRWRFRGGRFL